MNQVGKIRNWDWFAIPALVLISLIPRLYLLLHSHSYSSDGVSYLSTAIYLDNPELVGEVPKRIYFILYPFLVNAFHLFVIDIALAGRIINLIIGLLIPLLVYFLGRKDFGLLPSFLAGLLCAINPILVWQSAEIRGDNLFAIITIIAIIYFERVDWTKPSVKNGAIFGLIIGLSQLARTNGFLYLLVIIPIWLFWVINRKIGFRSWLIRTLIPFLIVFCLVSSIPHVFLSVRGEERPSLFVYIYLDGVITALDERESVFFSLNTDATEYQFLEDVENADFQTIVETLPDLPRKYWNNFVYSMTLFLGPVIDIALKLSIILIPLIFYIFYYWGEIEVPNNMRRILFWFFPSFFILPLIKIEDLYFLPIVPILLLILAWILVTASTLGWISKWRNLVLVVLMVIVASPMVYATYNEIADETRYKNPYVEMGKWLKENTFQDALIMARNPEIFFHAMRRGYRMPLEDINRTLIFAYNKKIDYIVFGPSEMKKREKLFLEAYDEVYRLGSRSRLKVVFIVDTSEGESYVLRLVPENFKVTSLTGNPM